MGLAERLASMMSRHDDQLSTENFLSSSRFQGSSWRETSAQSADSCSSVTSYDLSSRIYASEPCLSVKPLL